jgi:glycosyltransferase involved in cell wall biosynthesis
VPNLPLSLLKPSKPAQWNNIIKTLRSGQHAVLEVTENDPPNHIFALWALPSGYWAKVAGEKYGVPYSIWALGSDIWSLGNLPLIINVLQSVLRHSQYRFADGYQLANDVKNLSGLNCVFLPSTRKLSVQSEKELSTSPPYKLAYLGRWHPHKGTDLLLESLQLLDDTDWDKIDSVQICGGGPLEALVHEQCVRLQGNGRPITVRGYLNRVEATDLLLWADYLFLPSRIESIPVIFSDALQTKCPLIASPVGDIPHLMQNHHVGLLASAVTVQAISTAIRQALQTAPTTFQSGMNELAKEFNIENSVQHLLDHLWEQR